MRKVLVVLGILVSFCSLKAQNKYLDSTCEWRYFLTGSGWSSYLCTKYFDGDTVVNGIKFFRVCAAFAPTTTINRSVTYKSNMYFLAEDSNHNFVVGDFNVNPPTIEVLYKFDSIKSYNIGDFFPSNNLLFPQTCRWWPCDNSLDGYFSDTTNLAVNQIKRKDTFMLGSQKLIGYSNNSSLGNLCYNGYQGIIEGIGSVSPNFLGGQVCADVNTARLLYFDKGINRLLICTNPNNTVLYSNFPQALRGLNHFCSSTTLPLKLLSFTAKLQQKNVLLNWQTANEVNVSHINIQGSINSKDFTSVGKVNASCCNYSFTDQLTTNNLPLTISYRLEIVDKDGSKTYSEIKNVELGIRNVGISIYPNPTKDVVTIECASAKELLIIDYLGRAVFQSTITSWPTKVNTKQFAKGSYIVKTTLKNGNFAIEKLVVE